MNRSKLGNVFTILALLFVMLPVSVAAESAATIDLVPSASPVNVGDTINVDIRVQDVAGLYGAELHLTFDAARLQVLDDDTGQNGIQILPGSLFPSTAPHYVVQNQADNTAGKIDFTITLYAPAEAISGDGTLATIRFAARDAGTAQLSLQDAKLAGPDGFAIDHTTSDAQIVIATSDSPEPPDDRTCTDLIENGDFEENRNWDMPTTPHKAGYSAADKHHGSQSVRLGIESSSADVYSHSSAYQKVHVPANATSATLSFWAKRFTQETPKKTADPSADLYEPAQVIENKGAWASKDKGSEDDWQEVLILEAESYSWLATLMRDRSNDSTWTLYSYDLSAFAGQDIVVYMNVINNGTGNLKTWMYVDELKLDACYGSSTCSELVQNRSFEWSSDWWWGVTPRPAQYTTDAKHSGDRSMRLGVTTATADTYSHSSTYQHITIPAGATNPTLSFWYKAHSQDTVKREWTGKDDIGYDPAQAIAGQVDARSFGEEDWQEMLLLDKDYQLLSGGVVLRQVRNDGTWMQKSYDLSPYKGMEIVLYFNVINDGNDKRTWMYIDDVSVSLCGQQVHFEPAAKNVNVGDTFVINVRVEDIGSLYALDTTIGYDPAILEVTGAAAGDWWAGLNPYIVTNSIDNANGKLHFAATLQNPTPALNGSGNLVAVTFRAKAAGDTSLAFSALKLVDKNAVVIPASHADGQVTVGSGQATLSGKVLLEGRSDYSGTVVQLDGGATVTTGADGAYSFDTASGSHTLTFARASFLGHSLTTSATNAPQVTLLGGEVNNDDCIDILDLSGVASQFGSNSPSPAAADINGDGTIDIVDIVLVAKNFGTCVP